MGRRRKKISDQPFNVDIISLDSKAMGVALHEEKRLRVFDALPGENVLARNLFGRSRRGMAETLEVLQSSTDRVDPRCPHFGYCGACSLQHLSTQAQLAHKQAVLLRHLDETGNVKPQEVYPALSGSEWNYRRKARLSVRDVAAKERVLVGFRERDGRYVADMNECHILIAEIADVFSQLPGLIEKLDCRSHIPQIEVACGDQSSALVIRHLEAFSEPDFVHLREFADATGIGIYSQAAGPDSVCLLAPDNFALEYMIPDLNLHFRFEPLDFAQVNGALNRKMVMRALALLEPTLDDHVLDLFCGLGNFTLALATRAGQVTGVEGSQDMVGRAALNADLNQLSNVSFHKVDLYKEPKEGDPAVPWPVGDYTSIMLDPPRSGAFNLLPAIAASGVSKVLYISCNPETLAKDADRLVNEFGFTLKGSGILDMFPHTPHSEAIALFERAGLENNA
jgi:23S rRNA (uracil1939-C5)-methyltransferase